MWCLWPLDSFGQTCVEDATADEDEAESEPNAEVDIPCDTNDCVGDKAEDTNDEVDIVEYASGCVVVIGFDFFPIPLFWRRGVERWVGFFPFSIPFA